jgi:glycosyltransferase involved in cell wall biosynthesis
MITLFYVFGLLCIYSYFLYPLILIILPKRAFKPAAKKGDMQSELPTLSLIITAHNEEARIQEKLDNTLQIDYPSDLLEIIVASDFSTDETDAIVESFEQKGIRLVRTDAHQGKEYAQLCAIRKSEGEILVFSDVATQIPIEALQKLAARFDDPRIGAVSSNDRFISNDGSVVGEGAYVRYEMWLRGLESDHAGLVGLSGSFFAARRVVCEPWDIQSPSDFNTALNSAKHGMTAIICPEVVGIYKDVADASLEYRRKVRTVIRGITAIARHPEVLNPFSMGFFAFQVWSHKIMRWGVPWFMAAFLAMTLYLQGKGLIFTFALIAQFIFYGLAVIGRISEIMRKNVLIRLIFFFVQTNLALAQATVSFLLGKRMTVWTPSQR